jgi:hypothetical protein
MTAKCFVMILVFQSRGFEPRTATASIRLCDDTPHQPYSHYAISDYFEADLRKDTKLRHFISLFSNAQEKDGYLVEMDFGYEDSNLELPRD